MKRKSCSNSIASFLVNFILYELITNYYIIWWSWFAWIVYFRQVCFGSGMGRWDMGVFVCGWHTHTDGHWVWHCRTRL